VPNSEENKIDDQQCCLAAGPGLSALYVCS
jgi:hypothetical protein